MRITSIVLLFASPPPKKVYEERKFTFLYSRMLSSVVRFSRNSVSGSCYSFFPGQTEVRKNSSAALKIPDRCVHVLPLATEEEEQGNSRNRISNWYVFNVHLYKAMPAQCNINYIETKAPWGGIVKKENREKSAFGE